MNRAKIHLRLQFAIVIMVLFSLNAWSQSSAGQLPDNAIAQRKFVFRADWAIDYEGNRRQLTPPYELLVTSDSIDCHLPFLGRMYSVPAPDDLRLMSIRFVSKKYNYLVRENKRTGWEVTIQPEDVRNVQELYFNISGKGWATLAIRSADRDRISYEGTIVPLSD